MIKLLFKSTALYIIWQKFKKQIVLIFSSILLIFFIGMIYDDVFKILKVTNKENITLLFFIKWFLISVIIGFNIYILRKTKVNQEKEFSKNIREEEILNKEQILTRADLILKKYLNE